MHECLKSELNYFLTYRHFQARTCPYEGVRNVSFSVYVPHRWFSTFSWDISKLNQTL